MKGGRVREEGHVCSAVGVDCLITGLVGWTDDMLSRTVSCATTEHSQRHILD